MARPANSQPTDGELEILRILWADGPSALSAIRERLRPDRKVAATTVATMLRLMDGKGLVRRTGSGRGAVWEAIVSQQKTERGMVRKMVDRVFDGAADRLAAHLVQGGQLDDGQLQELRRLIDRQDKTRRSTTKAPRHEGRKMGRVTESK